MIQDVGGLPRLAILPVLHCLLFDGQVGYQQLARSGWVLHPVHVFAHFVEQAGEELMAVLLFEVIEGLHPADEIFAEVGGWDGQAEAWFLEI